MAGPLRGGGVKGQAIKEKRTFLTPFFSSIPMFQRPLSSRGVGGQALMARPLREELFFAASLKQKIKFSLYKENKPTQWVAKIAQGPRRTIFPGKRTEEDNFPCKQNRGGQFSMEIAPRRTIFQGNTPKGTIFPYKRTKDDNF